MRLREEMSLSGVEPMFDEARPLCVLTEIGDRSEATGWPLMSEP